MFYIDQPPWHGLGQKLDKPATAEEAIRAANLDWETMTVPLFAEKSSVRLDVKGTFGVVRKDLWGTKACTVLGIVGKQYTPLQNRDAFAFFDPIAGKGAAIYETAGVLGDGERVWILAKLPENIRVIGDDIVDKYLLLSNSHDGKSAVQVKFTPIRVVCQNTLTMALSEGPTLRIAHFKNLHKRLSQAEKLLGIIGKRFDGIEANFKEMVKVRLDGDRLSDYLSDVFPDPRDPENDGALAAARRNRLFGEYFFEEGEGNRLPGVRGTLWAAYNGITELVDHRQTKQTDDGRLNSVWFGAGYSIKARAYAIATDRIGVWRN